MVAATDRPLEEIQVSLDGRTWSILCAAALISPEQEAEFFRAQKTAPRPYGVMLWPAAIALAHDLATRDLAGKRVLEVGAGTGLPGMVAASRGACVVQTDHQELVLHLSRLNAARNGITTIEHRVADWTAWEGAERYDVILGSDILYAESLHPHLRRIFEANVGPRGTVLVSDPFRDTSIRLLEAMQTDGWRITMDKWSIGDNPRPRPVGVFTLEKSPRMVRRGLGD